ncbi:glycosyltransferase family 39 protein [bacterium]|nr:glycosyltransferase family 39 protein [bacterium]
MPLSRVFRAAVELALLAVVGGGVLARIVALPSYVPDSGDEWGNTITPLRVLYNHGNPATFLHPSLYYHLTAGAYAAVFGAARALGLVDPSLAMADLFVVDDRWFVFTARAVSVLSATLALWALHAIGRTLWDRTSGLAAAALLALLPLHAAYSDAARVDSLFLALFLFAFGRILLAARRPSRGADDLAAAAVGLATGANYNGGLLIAWLAAAQLRRAGDPPRARARRLARSALLSAAAFLISSPFVLLDLPTFARQFAFQSSLALRPHPGSEGRGLLFYAQDLIASDPLLAGTIAAGGLAIAVLGTRLERFAATLPVVYFALFSLIDTKYDRFILPALALFLLYAAGLPFVLARAARRQPIVARGLSIAALALLAANLAVLAPRAIPIPRHEQLEPARAPLLDWFAANAPPRARVLVESGIVPLLDAFDEPAPFGPALRDALARARPALSQEFHSAVFIGGTSYYDPAAIAARRYDFVVVSPRNQRYLERQCDAFPQVCAVYEALRSHARVAYRTPEGIEPALVYDLRP